MALFLKLRSLDLVVVLSEQHFEQIGLFWSDLESDYLLGIVKCCAYRSAVKYMLVKCPRELNCCIIKNESLLLNTDYVTRSRLLKYSSNILRIAGKHNHNVQVVR